MGCCLFALILAGAPRVATVLWWIARPEVFTDLFSTWMLPVIGVLFLPWTTLAYVLIGKNPGLFEWFILGFAFLLDIGAYGGGGGAARKRRRSD